MVYYFILSGYPSTDKPTEATPGDNFHVHAQYPGDGGKVKEAKRKDTIGGRGDKSMFKIRIII